MVTTEVVVKEVHTVMEQLTTTLKTQALKMKKRRKAIIHEMGKKRMNYSFMTCIELESLVKVWHHILVKQTLMEQKCMAVVAMVMATETLPTVEVMEVVTTEVLPMVAMVMEVAAMVAPIMAEQTMEVASSRAVPNHQRVNHQKVLQNVNQTTRMMQMKKLRSQHKRMQLRHEYLKN